MPFQKRYSPPPTTIRRMSASTSPIILKVMARIKERPEDFYVREQKSLELSGKGRYAYFLLRKRNMTTLEAVRRVAEALGVSTDRVGFAGLKDKRAVTEQYVSVEGLKSPREVNEGDLELVFLGYGNEPLRMGEIEGNYFEIRVRGVRRSRSYVEGRVDFVRRFGFENYFGEQRFGSVKYAEEFVLRHLIRGDYESALREYLTSMGDRKLRRALLRSWGRWGEFLRLMPEAAQAEHEVVRALLRGRSFEEAFKTLPRSIRLMFSFAYQSYLWNRYLTTFVVRYFKHCSVPFLKWRLAFITEMSERLFEEIRDLEIPFLGVEHRPRSGKLRLIVKEILREEGIDEAVTAVERAGLRLLTDGLRRAFVPVRDLRVLEWGGGSLKLSFTLPPGSYATVLLRKILCSPVSG